MSTKPEALRLAAQLDDTEGARLHLLPYAAAELRRLHVQAAQDEALLRQALEALERGAWDTLSGRTAAAAIRERLGEKV